MSRSVSVLFAVFAAMLTLLPAQASARTKASSAACAGYARLWQQAVDSGDQVLVLKRRSEAELLRAQCPDLLRQIDGYYPRDDVHHLAEKMLDSQFVRNNQIASEPSGLIYSGYDIVALVDSETMAEGQFANAALYKGAVYLFADQTNLDKFQQAPDRYQLAYGGYCAYCLAVDHVTGGTWEAIDRYKGKIYVFSAEQNKVEWLKKRKSYMARADRRWASQDWTQETVGFLDSDMGKLLTSAVSEVQQARATQP